MVAALLVALQQSAELGFLHSQKIQFCLANIFACARMRKKWVEGAVLNGAVLYSRSNAGGCTGTN